MNESTDIAARLRVLEDSEAIRRLKARYLLACDRKDVRAMRDCFADGEVLVDYGAVGIFRHRDALADVFQRLACHDHIVEMHHGMNAQIDIVDEAHARAVWRLHYQQIDTRAHKLVQLAGSYEDEYRRHDGAWKISGTRFVVESKLALDLPNGTNHAESTQ